MAQPRINYAAEAGPFLGRERDAERLSSLLVAGERLVTVLGIGGIGKTRFVKEWGRGQLAAFPGGVWLCELESARSFDDALRMLQGALGGTTPHGDSSALVDQLGRALDARGRALVLLDNFEQLVAVAAPLVAALHSAAPTACIVVTSRARLELVAEVPLELPPLDTQGEDSAALRLFLACARRARGERVQTPQERAAASALVRRLDGIPLAIELLAARAGVLGPAQMSARLDTLDVSAPRAAAHRNTLRATLDWSFELLSAVERSALAQLAVFQSRFLVEDAEAVVEVPQGTTVAALAALRDQSMVRGHALNELGGAVAFSLFESVRDYAREKLGASVADALNARYAQHVIDKGLRLAAPSLPPVVGERAATRWSDALSRLAVLRDDLVAVHARACANGEAATALRAALALAPLCLLRGQGLVLLRLLDDALCPVAAAAGATDPPARSPPSSGPPTSARAADASPGTRESDAELRARGLLARAEAALSCGHGADATRDVEAAATFVPLLAGARQEQLGARVMRLELTCLRNVGRLDEGRRRARDAVALIVREGAASEAALLLEQCAWIEHDLGESTSAFTAMSEALERARSSGDRALEGRVLRHLSCWLTEAGRLKEARRAIDDSARIHDELGDPRMAAITRGGVGCVLCDEGRVRDACAHFADAARAVHLVGDVRYQGIYTAYLGMAEEEASGAAAARPILEAAVGLLVRAHEMRFLALTLAALGACAAALDDRAATLDAHERAASLLLRVGDPLYGTACALYRTRAAVSLGDAGVAQGAAALSAAVEAMRRSDDVRRAARTLRAVLGAKAPPPDALVVAADGSWMRPPAGKPGLVRERCALTRRRTARLLLLFLVDLRLARPGAAASLEELVAAGWPDEHVRADAGANRVHVALHALRRLGLADALRRTPEGWLLDAVVPVVRVSS